MLEHLEIGVAAAKKGWIQKETVINTWETEKLLDFIRRHK
jgi:DNA polymerase (family 10)